MFKVAQPIVTTLALLILSATCGLQADELSDLLGPPKSDLKESSPATLKLWDDFLTSLEQNDFVKGRKLAVDFDAVQDFTEPWQKSYTKLIVEILDQKQKAAAADTDAKQVMVDKDFQAQITDKRKQKEDTLNDVVNRQTENQGKKSDIADQETKLADAQDRANKKSKDSDVIGSIGGVIGGRIGNVVSGTASADKAKAERDVQTINATIALLKQDIAVNETAIINDQKTITDLDNKVALLNNKATEDVKSRQQAIAQAYTDQAHRLKARVLDFMNKLVTDTKFRPAVILASTYTQNIGEDADISASAQAAVNLQKTQAKAVAVAQAASKSVTEALAQRKLWTAKAELVKANETINERVSDPQLKNFVALEMGRITRDVNSAIAAAMKKQALVMEMASRDAVAGSNQLESFIHDYTDYPDYEQDKLKISDLRVAQVAQKWEKRFAAIREVNRNDSVEAKKMVQRLQAEIDPDQLSILKSEIVKLQRDIFDRERAEIKAQMDEAQSYLTKFVNTNTHDGRTDSTTVGVENLVRARSVQAGAVKRLELLLGEEMDNVTRSELVGLLETQKAALAQMDDTLSQQHSSKTVLIVIVAGIVLLFAALLVVVLVVLKLRKKPAVVAPALTK